MTQHPSHPSVSAVSAAPSITGVSALTALLLSATLLLGLSLLACSSPKPQETQEPQVPAAAADEVVFEPAYPEEVSAEDLSEDDVRQQETHSHGDGEEHSHSDDDPQDPGGDDHDH